MKFLKNNTMVIIFYMIFFQNILVAQTLKEDTATVSTDETPDYCIRVAGGLGPSSISFGGLAYARVDLKNLFFSVRVSEASEIIPSKEGPSPSGDEISILAGLSYTTKIFYMSAGAGIGKVSTVASRSYYPPGISKLTYDKITNSGIGLPIQFDIFWTPGTAFGLGMVIYFNINKYNSFGGFAICIQFGKLR